MTKIKKMIKLIDLLNDIANKKEVPKKIKYTWIYEWKYDESRDNYGYLQVGTNDRFDSDWLLANMLNEDIEIVEDVPEEDDEITKWGKYVIERDVKKCNEKDLRTYISMMMSTQNEIIDKIKGE